MRNEWGRTLLVALLILFGLQQLYLLVEAIYMLNLLHTSLDARALGVLFLYSGILLLVLKKSPGQRSTRLMLSAFLLLSALSPWLTSQMRIYSAGLAVGLFFILMPMAILPGIASDGFMSMAPALALSVLLRVLGGSQDITLVGWTRLAGVAFVGVALVLLFQQKYQQADAAPEKDGTSGSSVLAALGFTGGLFLLYAALFTPAVLARWTGADYRLVHVALAAALIGAVLLGFVMRSTVTTGLRFLANALFVISLMAAILRHRIDFPATADAAPVVVPDGSDVIGLVALLLALLLSPIVLFNMAGFARRLAHRRPREMAVPLFAAGVFLSLLIFMLIFTNVWGYVDGLSRPFRNQFHLPFLIAGVMMTLAGLAVRPQHVEPFPRRHALLPVTLSIAMILLVLLNAPRPAPPPVNVERLTVMTYNIQQGVDFVGEKNYARQLAVIRRVNPDVLCLQESDVARISGGGSDIVRYFAEGLDSYSFYGPKTVTGTFGTAILSRYPLQNASTVFTYSDADEIGTACAEIEVSGNRVLILCNHPAGGKKTRRAHTEMVMHKIRNKKYVIAAGDFNFRQTSPWYKEITTELLDCWLAVWPDGVGDMSSAGVSRARYDERFASGEWLDDTHLTMPDRIDHIFVSPTFEPIEAAYLPVPESESDHPAHWVVLKFRDATRIKSDLLPISD